MLNFDQLMQLHASKANDRNAIATAMRMSVEQIDRWQTQAVMLAQSGGGQQNILKSANPRTGRGLPFPQPSIFDQL